MCNYLLHNTESVLLAAKFIDSRFKLVKDEVLEESIVAKTLFLEQFLDHMSSVLVL